MTSRIALPPNTELRFGPDTCFSIKKEVGRGGSCIVYDAVYKTNAGDEKIVRVKECYPFDIPLEREPSGTLACPESASRLFADAKAQMYEDFRLCNRLFFSETFSDAVINTINIYEKNNTVYVVSTWAQENVLSSLELHSLRDCVSIVRQTASAIQSIHQAGYLYLDIKPENISVVSSSSKRIQLFDFNSLIPVSALKEDGNSFLSYTKGFAALELRRGQFSKLGFYTDIYGIGALLFFLLFRRTPEAPECVQGANYDFTKLSFPDSFPDKLLLHLEIFFRKTLAAFPPDRWQHMDDVVRELELIEHLSDPIFPYLISTPINPPSYFIGRSGEMEELEAWYKDDMHQHLFVTGMGGIGKSTFIRQFLAKHRQDWDSVCLLYFHNNIRQTITDETKLKINGMERMPGEKEADYFERKLQKLHEIIERDRVFLVIDNFENQHDPYLNKIFALNCRVIFISRNPLGSLNLPVLKLEALNDENDLRKIFIHYLDHKIEPSESDIVREIIRQLDGHTLAIELFARQISNSFITLTAANQLLKKEGVLHAGSDQVDYLRDDHISYEQLETIIMRLFETDSLLPEQISLLKAITLFPAPGINVRELVRLTGIDTTETILCLVQYGWITRDQEQVFLHPLIRDVIRNLPGTEAVMACVQSVLLTLYKEIISESHMEEIDIREFDKFSEELEKIDFYDIVTDYQKLNSSVTMTRSVIDALSNDPQISGRPLAQKLFQSMVINLPKHEDEAVINYGMVLLTHPEYLSPVEILEVVESVEKAFLARQDYKAAFQLIERAEEYTVDERTKAEFCGLVSNIYDYRDAPGDQEEMLAWLETGIDHARLAPPPERKHLLAEYLLSKLNVFTRNSIEDDTGIDGLIRELMDIMDKECLPYSEIRCGFATAMGFYWAELEHNRKEADEWIELSQTIGERLYPDGIDFIDNCIIPPAIMYIDMKEYSASESTLQKGIRICEKYPDLIAYSRKKHDLHRFLLDVYLEKGDYTKAGILIEVLDRNVENFGFPDTVHPDIRFFLSQNKEKG